MNELNMFSGYKKEWNTSCGVLKLKTNHSTKESCFLLQTDEKLHKIPLSDVVGIPQAVLEDNQKLAAFTKDSYARVSMCDDGTHKIYINQKLLGGGNIEQNSRTLWPNARVPYNINTNVFPQGSDQYQAIMQSIASWNNAGTGFQFVQRTNEVDYVEFDWSRNATHSCLRDVGNCSICESNVGRQGGKQLINCDLLSAQNFNAGSIKHEMGHAIGLYHEQQRNDRDNYVKVKDDIPADDANYGKETADKRHGEYDFRSIMHYHFFNDGKMKIRSTIPAYQHQQIKELGNNQTTPFNNLAQQQLDAIENLSPNQDIWNGVFQVGAQSNLSQGDIAAASELARRGKNFQTFKNIAQQADIQGDINSAIKYYAITQRVWLANNQNRGSDVEATQKLTGYYQTAENYIRYNNISMARQIFEKLSSECYDQRIGELARSKLNEINNPRPGFY